MTLRGDAAVCDTPERQIVPGADADMDWLVAHVGDVFMQHCIGHKVQVDTVLTCILDTANTRM